jgi:hypothetical protein
MLSDFMEAANGCSFSLREKVRMRGNAAQFDADVAGQKVKLRMLPPSELGI